MGDEQRTSRRILMTDATGLGFNQNLLTLRNEILRTRPEWEIDYFFASAAAMSGTRGAAQRRELADRCRRADVVVCASDSLPPELTGMPAHQRRVLLNTPKIGMIDGRPVKPVASSVYTHHVIQNPASEPYVRARYGGSRCEIRACGLPALDVFAEEDAAQAARHKLLDLCPQSEGREVLAVSSHLLGSVLVGPDTIDMLGTSFSDRYFVVMVAPWLSKAFNRVGAEVTRHFFNAHGCFKTFELLLMADAFATTRFGEAVYFSAREKPLAFIEPDGAKLPPVLEALRITNLTQVPEALESERAREAARALRTTFVAPNVQGNARRIITEVFDAD